MRVKGWVVLVLVAALSGQAVWARDIDAIRHDGRLIACAGRNALPVSAKGAPEGYQIEIAREMAQDLGVRLFVEWTWASYQAKHTDCDLILGTARDPKPANHLRYLQALSDVEILLVFRGPARPVALGDLDGLTIAAPSASLAHFALLETGADVRVAYRTEQAILRDLSAGVLDGGVVSNIALQWHRHVTPDAQLFGLSTDLLGVISQYPMTIALRRSDSLAAADFEDIIATMHRDGRLDAILGRYGLTLSQAFDDPYAKVVDDLSEPEGSQLRRDIVEDLEQRAQAWKSNQAAKP